MPIYSASCTVEGPSVGPGSAGSARRANRRSRLSWAFRILAISLRRFSNVFLFFAISFLVGGRALQDREPTCTESTTVKRTIAQLRSNCRFPSAYVYSGCDLSLTPGVGRAHHSGPRIRAKPVLSRLDMTSSGGKCRKNCAYVESNNTSELAFRRARTHPRRKLNVSVLSGQ